MDARNLGGLSVPAVGYGCMGLSGIYGAIGEAEAATVLNGALDLGIRLFDTSDSYGPHANETLVGRALGRRRDEALIATKFGQQIHADGTRTINGRPDYVRAACDASLKRLGIEHIDLYFVHRIDKTVPIEETVGAMAELVAAGKLRFIGLSEASATTIRRAHAVHPLAAVQTEYSLWTREVEAEILPTLRQLGIGFVAYSPLGRGFLAGRTGSDAPFAEKDTRRTMPRFQPEKAAANIAIVDGLRPIAERRGVSLAQLALAWVLSRGRDIVAIPGSRRLERVRENMAAAEIVLSPEDLAEIDRIAPRGAASGDRYRAAMMGDLDL